MFLAFGVWALQTIFLIGLGWVLSLITVVMRDLQQILAYFVLIIMIASPIAYNPEVVPSEYKFILYLNPYYPFLVAYQDLIGQGTLPPARILLTCFLLSSVTFFVGRLAFRRLKPIVADYA